MHLTSEVTLRTPLLGIEQSEGLCERSVPVPIWRLGHVGPQLLSVIHRRVRVPARVEQRSANDDQVANAPARVPAVVFVRHNRPPAVAGGTPVIALYDRQIVVEGEVGHSIEVDHVLETWVAKRVV